MTEEQVVKFEYQQSLSFTAGKSWSEQIAVSVRIQSEAFSSGWYREMFGKEAKAFIVLMAIVMHARPLRGNDLDLLIRLGMATADDEGRLYARVTDMGLADELGIHRDTVAACANKLAALNAKEGPARKERELIQIVSIPSDVEFRDSHGQFAGSKVYLISGNLDQMLQKAVSNRAENSRTVKLVGGADGSLKKVNESHRAENFNTVESAGEKNDRHHAEKFRMDRAESFGSLAENFRTNIDSDSDSDVVAVNGVAADLPFTLAYFAKRKNNPDYRPTEKELHSLKMLLADGFDLETEIIPGIERAFENAKTPIHSFNYCAQVIRQARKAAINEQKKREWETREAAEPIPIAVPDVLAEAVQILTLAFGMPDRPTVVRLLAMAKQCESAAIAEDSSGGEWVTDALVESLGQANPQHLLTYTSRKLRGWCARGRCKPRYEPQVDPQLPPEVTIFQQATGRLPLRDQVDLVARTIREHNLTADYLKPFWEEWITRDRRRTDLTWFTWAVKGEILDATQHNGRNTSSGLDEFIRNAALLAQKG